MTPDEPSPLAIACHEWLVANLHHFQIAWAGDTHEIFRHLKIYGELGLLASLNCRALAKGLPSELQQTLTDWLTKNPPAPDVLRAIVLEFPQAFPWVGMLWQNRAQLQLASDQLRQVVAHLATVPSVLYFERHVGHDICVHNILDALNLESPFSLPELYSRTMLAKQTWDDPSDTVLYYLCHDAFYMSDWGARPVRDEIRSIDLFINKLRGWYARCAGEGNIDLAAEIVLALSFLREPVDIEILEVAASHSINISGLPRPPKGQGGGFIRPGDAEDRVQFFQNYHTVLVCLMALTRNWRTNLLA
jgi:hypothetical protein